VEIMTTASQRQHFTQAPGTAGRIGGAIQPTRPPSRTAATPARIEYRIVEADNSPRVWAVNENDQVIVGAFRPPEKNYWLLYFTPLVAQAAGVPFRPDHVPLWSREQAHQWVDLIAHLYCHATQLSGAA
jgi:hypothetical protein